MILRNQIVVSRFNEDITWLKALASNDWIQSIIVYNKGLDDIKPPDKKVEIIKALNVGREGGTYLDYIIDNYEKLPEKIWFIQADPILHSPDFLNLMKKESVKLYEDKLFQGLSDRWKTSRNIPPINIVDITSPWQINGNRCVKYFIGSDLQVVGHCAFKDQGIVANTGHFLKFYGDRHIFGYMANIAGIAEPKPITEFYYSACFFVNRNAILSNPRSSYLRLKDFLLESDPQGSFQGYMLERFWPYLFEQRSFKTLTECYRDVIKGNYIGVYCSVAKKIWIKENRIKHVFNNNSNIIIFKDNEELKTLPGLNYYGEDLYIQRCDTIQIAKDVFNKFIELES